MTDDRKLFALIGKTAVVLGAGSGIGKSSAEALVRDAPKTALLTMRA